MTDTKCGVWNKQQMLKLMELWKGHPNLYDTKLPAFHKRNIKRETIGKMKIEMQLYRPGTSEEEITSKMANLKTQFQRALKKPRTGSAGSAGSAARKKNSELWCLEELKWLQDHLEARASVSNVTPLTEQKLSTVQVEEIRDGNVPNVVIVPDDVSEPDFQGAQVYEIPIDDDDDADLLQYLHCYKNLDFSSEKKKSDEVSTESKKASCNDLTSKNTSVCSPVPQSSSDKKKTPAESLVKILGETSTVFKNMVDSKADQTGLGPLVEKTFSSLTPRRAKRFRKDILRCCADAEDD